jgi:hypothetical protein
VVGPRGKSGGPFVKWKGALLLRDAPAEVLELLDLDYQSPTGARDKSFAEGRIATRQRKREPYRYPPLPASLTSTF